MVRVLTDMAIALSFAWLAQREEGAGGNLWFRQGKPAQLEKQMG
jgi:hypothetical protein